MKIRKYLIAGGNSTLIVWDYQKDEMSSIIQQRLGEVEQIGFATKNVVHMPTFKMMGNEFSGNGTLAFASTLGKKGVFQTSGLLAPVKFENNKSLTTITIDMPYTQVNNIILFEGIGYLCSNKNNKVEKEELEKLAEKYSLPAFGIIINNNGKISPYVYVRKTQSLFNETACGSGSIATSIVTGLTNITQPTNQIIRVEKNKNIFKLTAKITEITM